MGGHKTTPNRTNSIQLTLTISKSYEVFGDPFYPI